MNKMKFQLVFLILILSAVSGFAQRQKLAQTGLKFINVSLDAKSAGMANAVTALTGNSASMFYNPASMGFDENKVDVSLGRANWIADINHIYGSASFQPAGGEWGVFGVTYRAVDYGELIGTIVYPNEQGYLDIGSFKPTAMSVGIGYAKALSEKFAVGGNINYVRQNLGSSVVDVKTNNNGGNDFTDENNSVNVLSFDFGILYKTGFKSLNFGMSVRNFSAEIRYKEEGFQLPLIFSLGLSIDAMDLFEIDKSKHSLLVSIDAVHPRDYYEQINLGLQYTFYNIVSLRAGYSAPNDEKSFSYGVGIQKDFSDLWFGLDYAYTPFGIFKDVHRFTFNFLF